MKKTLSIIFLFAFLSSTAQENTLKFINNKTVYWNKTDIYNDKVSINEINLKQDSTFTMWSRPSMSCWSWRSYDGTWERKNDTLVLFDQYEISANNLLIEFQTDKKRKEYVLNFRTDKNSTLINKEIKVDFVYDFNSKLDYEKQIMTINNYSQIIIPFKEVPKRRKLAALRIEYMLKEEGKKFGYITENSTVNVKTTDLPNIINLVFVEEPERQIIYREIKGVIVDNKFVILSKSKTKAVLLEFNREIILEKEYNLKSNL